MKKYKINIDLVWEEDGEDLVILDGKLGQVHRLNRTAKDIFLGFSKPVTIKELIRRMGSTYVDIDNKEVVLTVHSMIRKKLLLVDCSGQDRFR